MSLKILFLSHRFYPDVGGIEVNSEILANAFHHAGHTVRLLTWSTDYGDKKFPFVVKRNPNLGELFREHQWADIVYENNLCLRLAWPSIFFNRPDVVALRTWVTRSNGTIKWQDKLKLRWLHRARAVIAVSDAVRKKCWPAARVIGNPYRAEFTNFNPRLKRCNNFVFVGRLVSDKGADLAIQAVHQLLKGQSGKDLQLDYSLTIIGDGPDRRKLEELTAELGIKSKVFFTGTLQGNALIASLNKHKYILIPSLWEEPFGNVALEGMACGCIPIVSDGGGLPEAVGTAGIVFPRGNLKALTQAILRVLHNDSLEKQLRQAAKLQLAAHHPKVITGQYLEVIERAKQQSSK